MEVDHIVNLASGGVDDDDNLQALCARCHEEKTRREIVEGHRRRWARGFYPPESHPGLLV